MAGLLARGSMQLAAFPSCRLRTDISGIGQVLAAYSCGGSRGIASPRLGRRTRTTFPHRSFLRRRPSSRLVQPRAGALSMAKAPARQRSACGICRARGIYCRRRGDALPWRRCQVLVQALGLASETGSWCERCIAAQSQHCPRNGKRIKANIDVTAPERRGKTFAGHTGVRESGDRPGIEQWIPSRWANWVMLCRGGFHAVEPVLRRALQNPVLSPIPVRFQRLAGIPSAGDEYARCAG